MNKSIYDHKANFVEELKNFYINVVGNQELISDMHYSKEVREGTDYEYVYVTFTCGQKRFSVWGDNNQGILMDFIRFLKNFDQYKWLREEEQQ